MRALLPVYCRLLGYFVIALALFLPFLMLMLGKMTDSNLLFYKECSKLLMMLGALMILFAYTKNENKETEKVRNTATRNAMFLTSIIHLWRYALSPGEGRHHERGYFLFFDLSDTECSLPGIWYKESGS